jgi:K+-transporting ATPase c subunit
MISGPTFTLLLFLLLFFLYSLCLCYNWLINLISNYVFQNKTKNSIVRHVKKFHTCIIVSSSPSPYNRLEFFFKKW